MEGALYSVEALEAGTFLISVDLLSDVGCQRAEEIRAVLRLVIEDLNDGIIGLGRGAARGYGSVRVEFPAAGEAGGLPGLEDARSVLTRMVRDSSSE
jgi:CRISPR/Cas system CSM-associated protein Csm3 (group 7 of RAMP superfamily)